MSASALDKAIESGDLARVKQLVEAGADLSHMGAYDSTPLANAVFWGREEVVAYLLNVGADPNLGGCSSTLVRACGAKNIRIARMLLEAGVDPDDGDTEGTFAIGMSIFVGDCDLVKLLISYGADFEPLDECIEYAEELNSNGSHNEVIAYLKQLNGSKSKSG